MNRELLDRMHTSLAITFGTTAPYRFERHRVERVGFAGDPAITLPVYVREQDVSAVIPIARQRVYAELAERGIEPTALEFRPNLGGSYRRRKFTDDNPSSPSYGKSKFGSALELRFFMTRELARQCEWRSYSNGQLPDLNQETA